MQKLTTSITKILDLSIDEVGEQFRDSLGEQTYTDEVLNEHIWDPTVLSMLQQEGQVQVSDPDLLDQIFKICEKKDCAYFRIVS